MVSLVALLQLFHELLVLHAVFGFRLFAFGKRRIIRFEPARFFHNSAAVLIAKGRFRLRRYLILRPGVQRERQRCGRRRDHHKAPLWARPHHRPLTVATLKRRHRRFGERASALQRCGDFHVPLVEGELEDHARVVGGQRQHFDRQLVVCARAVEQLHHRSPLLLLLLLLLLRLLEHLEAQRVRPDRRLGLENRATIGPISLS